MSGAIKRYRFMAIFSGVMSLLIWFLYVPVKHLMHNPDLVSNLTWIPLVHGYTYPIYVLAAINFGLKARLSFKSLLFFILAGTLPVASLIAERRVVRSYP
ncbi:MAG: DUF3817 domain-containing protein [Candidatus Planktophila sp.]|nr:DUF3817 domain-containing protein [Candidatus Planktophila sp.]